MSVIDRHVGAVLCASRDALHMTLDDVANHVGVTCDHVEAIEAGLLRATASELYELCNLLRITPTTLYEGIELNEGEDTFRPSPGADG